MNGWNDFFYFFIIGATLLLDVLGFCLTIILPDTHSRIGRFFRTYFIVLTLGVFSVLLENILFFYPVPAAVIRFMQVPICLLLSLPLSMQTFFLLFYCKENICQSRLLRTVLGLWSVYFVLVVSGLFTDSFYTITPAIQVLRGPWYPLMLLPLNAIVLLNLTALFKRRKLLSRKVCLSFLIALLPIALTVLVQLFVDVFLLIGICTALFALATYGFILSDQIDRDRRQQKELFLHEQEIARKQRQIANERANVMVLQMRPHFIYNTLSSIYCLCDQDPKKAQNVLLDFTVYLRKNFTSIASTDPIPFSSELEHTRAYLAVEQVQYEDSLTVEYDTPHTLFRVPALTLQPIVENSVKHGRDPNAEPLHILIQTRETDSGSKIIVMDNGKGFDPDETAIPGIALENIRQRLEMMCGGSLTIERNEGGGTVVTVVIPDRIN
ncbi:MAG: histidine kinase [Lachnospiraceae bacterium]|nr:histidine kinase [Lachnospiraceae bacterium]